MIGNSYFPIKKGVACPLKWSWNTIRLSEASSACCHRVDPVPLTPDNFDNFHNNEVWLEHRKMQLEGKFPQQGCQYCENIEIQGGLSDRLYYMNQVDMCPPELDKNPEAIHVTPTVLEIFINNRCNLSCIYCDESNSSRIAKENKKFGYFVPGESPNQKPIIPIVPKTTNYDLLLNKFFNYLEKNYQSLRNLNVLGGEPFYQKEFYTLIDFINQNKNQNLNLAIVTNLMVSPEVLKSSIEKFKQILVERKLKRVDFTVSIDCWGAEQEYVRYGIELDQWKKNFEYLISHKWLYITINSTITSLTIKTLPDLLNYINNLREIRPIYHGFGLVDGKTYLHPKIFGPKYFNKDFDNILSSMPDVTEQDKLRKQYMEGIKNSLNNSIANLELKNNLKNYLTEIDRRRGTNWKKTFPWLELELNNVV